MRRSQLPRRPITVEELLDDLDLKPGELHVLDGSPPCQGFSLSGKRQEGDDRNQLFREFVRLLEGLRPHTFVMENVTGMVVGSMKPLFNDILRTLEASGYRVVVKELIASWLGVPQRRPRLIFIGVREDLADSVDLSELHPRPTVTRPVSTGEAIRDLEDPGAFCHSNTFSIPIYATMRAGLVPVRSYGVEPENRSLGVCELKRVTSFPDQYQFDQQTADSYDRERFQEVWARLGNCVPPLMMRAIAANLRARFNW